MHQIKTIKEKSTILIYGLIEEDEDGFITETIGLRDMVRKELPNNWPEVDLYMASLDLAINDKDFQYVCSEDFFVLYKSLGLNVKKLRQFIFKIWNEGNE